MKKLMVFFILCCAASAASPPTSAAQDASDYLGPEPGVTLVFESSDGVRIERKTVGMEDGVLRIEEKALIPAEMPPTKESITDTRVYELAAEGARLLQKQPGGNKVLLDLSREKWTVPQDHGGQGPYETPCLRGEPSEREILGRKREAVDVVCSYTVNNVEAEAAFTPAEGLGLVRSAALDGGKVVNEMRLVDMEGD